MAFKDLHYSQMEADIMRKNQSLLASINKNLIRSRFLLTLTVYLWQNSNFPC